MKRPFRRDNSKPIGANPPLAILVYVVSITISHAFAVLIKSFKPKHVHNSKDDWDD